MSLVHLITPSVQGVRDLFVYLGTQLIPMILALESERAFLLLLDTKIDEEDRDDERRCRKKVHDTPPPSS